MDDVAARLTNEAAEIVKMAESLMTNGLRAEAVSFALIAANRLRAARALTRTYLGSPD